MASVWGIDIGKAALKAVKLRKDKEGLEIQAIEYIPYPIEEDEDERQEHVNDAIRSFLTKHKLGSDTIVVGIPGLHAFSRFIKLPPVDKSKIGMMVRMEAQQQIPFPIAEVNWDFTKIDRVYEEGEEIEVGIFATRSELIDGFLSDMQDNGLTPDVVTIAPLAVYNFVRYNNEEEDGATIILDIGAEHTDLVIMDGERFWIRNLRIAGNDISKALADRFKIPFAEAEKLKKSSAKSQQAKKIFNSMEPVLKDLIGEIHRSVGFFKSQAEDLEVKRMVLLGDGAKLRNLPKFLQGQLKYDVQRVARLAEDHFVIEDEVDVDVLKNHLLGFGVAFGLGIQGMKRIARCSINLAPQQMQLQSKLRSKLPFAIVTALCTWLALGVNYNYWTSNRQKIQTTLKKIGKVKTIVALQEEAKGEREGIPALEAQSQAYTKIGGGRTLVLGLMEKVNKLLPQANDTIPSMTPAERSKPINEQIQLFERKREDGKVNEKKTWLLEWHVRRREVKDPGPRPYKVTLKLARAIPRGEDATKIREDIKEAFANPLIRELGAADGPYYIRDGSSTPPVYNSVVVSVSKEIYGLDASLDNDGRHNFRCAMVEISFEVGVPPPPKKPPAAAPPPEGGM